jgi:HAE1 family hydrophobic/amphiphilic exporter-1
MERSGNQKLKFDDKELSVEIKAMDVDEYELDDILTLNLQNQLGIPFRIRDVVDIELSTQKGGITRENQEYVAMIRWDYLGSSKAGDRFHKTLYKNLKVPVGFKKSLEERKFRMTEEEEGQLTFAIILSLFLIYLLLGMLYENFFQPLLIMLSVPLALIGVFIAFVIMDYSFDSTAYIGVILLSGIVVNNAILLIDNINKHAKKNHKIIEAIAIGAKERIRPIFMTSATTVLGMLPLIILKKSDATDIWSSLALCTVGGLTTSAFFILFVLPIFYYLFYKLQRFLFKTASES